MNAVDPLGLAASVWLNGKKRRVKTVSDVEGFILEVGRTSGSIYSFRYRGHGNMKGWLDIGGDEMLGPDFARFLEEHKALFDEDAKYELEACGSANPFYEGFRLVDRIRSLFPDAEIWGFTGLAWGVDWRKYAPLENEKLTEKFREETGVMLPFPPEWVKVP